jgi:hypothetical protein
MGNVIKFRVERKRRERQREEAHASANRLLYGRSKAERKLQHARDAKAHADLDRHRIETGDER